MGNFEVPTKLVALLAFIFLALTIWSNWMILDQIQIEKVSGNAVSGTLSICILFTDPFRTVLEKPGEADVLGGNETFNASIEVDPNYEIKYVLFYRASNMIGNATNVTNFNSTHDSHTRLYDTTQITDRNCNYEFSVRVNANTTCNPISLDQSRWITVNNHDVEPTWDSFKNSLTTNFSAMTNPGALHDYAFIENASIGVPGAGLIQFNGMTINFDETDLDTYILIKPNNITINTHNDNMRCLFMHNGSNYNVTFYNLSFGSPIIVRNGFFCGDQCVITHVNGSELSFYTDSFDNVSFTIRESANFEIFDETDEKGGNYSRYINEQVKFFANYSNNATNLPISAPFVYCKIRINVSGNYTNWVNMTFNPTSRLYEYSRSFTVRDTYLWHVICNDTSYTYNPGEGYDYLNITNRPPYLVDDIPDQAWPQDTSLSGLDLNDYFNDSDGDILTYIEDLNLTYTPNIDVTISTEGIVVMTPHYGWSGVNYIVFNASDSIDTNVSNVVMLTVQTQEQHAASLISTSGGGGGGGGACKPDWWCTEWSVCSEEGLRTRVCVDLNNCGTKKGKPSEEEECVYVPECYNGVQDQAEDGIDCGGPCPPCATCDDGILNCHNGSCEVETDCGGPCPSCPNCTDGIRNQDEKGIDCGGICPNKDCCNNSYKDVNEDGIDCGGPCPEECKKPVIEAPKVVEKHRNMVVITFAILLILMFILLVFKISHPYISKYLTKLSWRFSTIKKRKQIVVTKVYNSRVEVLNKLKGLDKKLSEGEVENLTNDFFLAIRRFFKDLFKIDYEFSYEELMKELTREKIDHSLKMILISFFKKVSDIRFSGHEISKTELQSLIDEARSIVNMTTKKTEQEKQMEISAQKSKEILLKAEGLDKIFGLISRAQDSLNRRNYDGAKQSYFKIIEEYNRLPLIKKEKTYESIRRLYEEIKLLEKR